MSGQRRSEADSGSDADDAGSGSQDSYSGSTGSVSSKAKKKVKKKNLKKHNRSSSESGSSSKKHGKISRSMTSVGGPPGGKGLARKYRVKIVHNADKRFTPAALINDTHLTLDKMIFLGHNLVRDAKIKDLGGQRKKKLIFKRLKAHAATVSKLSEVNDDRSNLEEIVEKHKWNRKWEVPEDFGEVSVGNNKGKKKKKAELAAAAAAASAAADGPAPSGAPAIVPEVKATTAQNAEADAMEDAATNGSTEGSVSRSDSSSSSGRAGQSAGGKKLARVRPQKGKRDARSKKHTIDDATAKPGSKKRTIDDETDDDATAKPRSKKRTTDDDADVDDDATAKPRSKKRTTDDDDATTKPRSKKRTTGDADDVNLQLQDRAWADDDAIIKSIAGFTLVFDRMRQQYKVVRQSDEESRYVTKADEDCVLTKGRKGVYLFYPKSQETKPVNQFFQTETDSNTGSTITGIVDADLLKRCVEKLAGQIEEQKKKDDSNQKTTPKDGGAILKHIESWVTYIL